MRKFLIAALPLLFAVPAWGCTVEPGYRRPSNFELIQRADLVVLAQVESETQASRDDWRAPNIWLRPIRAIKGTLPRMPLGVSGGFSFDQRPVAPHPTSLDEVHPSALWGACIRQAYAKGTLVVATFVLQPDGQYRQITAPFARAVEDVESEDGLWVRAATLYASLAGSMPAELAARLEVEASRLEAIKDDPAATAIAADLRFQFAILARGTPPGW